MKLTETMLAEASTETVSKDDPNAIPVTYVGVPPGTHDPKHPENKPTGDLMPGESGMARPIHPEHPGYMWYFTSDKGFSMVVPPHDIRKARDEERYPQLRTQEDQPGIGFGPKKPGEDVPGWRRKGSLADLI